MSSIRFFAVAGVILGLVFAYVVERYERKIMTQERDALSVAYQSQVVALSTYAHQQKALADAADTVVQSRQKEEKVLREDTHEARKVARDHEDWASARVPLDFVRLLNREFARASGTTAAAGNTTGIGGTSAGTATIAP